MELNTHDAAFKKDFVKRFSQDFKDFYDNHEIEESFYKNVSKTDFMKLINSPDDFYEKFKNTSEKKQIHIFDKIKLLLRKREK